MNISKLGFTFQSFSIYIYIERERLGGVCGAMVIDIENGQGNQNSNPGWDSLDYT